MSNDSVNAPGFGSRGWVASETLLAHPIKFAALLAIIAVYYLFLLSNGSFSLIVPEMLGRVFNSMLLHLLRGQFYVDPKVIDFEGIIHDGKTYAYFGVFPALLRLLAMPFIDVAQADLARLSCLTAVTIYVALQLRMLLTVHNGLPTRSRTGGLLAVMITATVLSGPQLYILASASIYHEPILWAAVMAAAYNLVVIQAVTLRGGSLDNRDLGTLAVLAGLALLTRVSIGAALYFGTILLVAWTAWHRHGKPAELMATVAAAIRDWCLWPSVLILGLFAAVVGGINVARWGNPLTFADVHHYLLYLRHPKYLEVQSKFGEFNLGRIWIGALYYATGIPYLLKSVSPFGEFLATRVVGIEAPPLTPLLTNPLTVLLVGIGIYRLWWRPELPAEALTPLRLTLIGHAVAVFLILSYIWFTLRYRFDFAPFMTLGALVGYRCVSATAAEASETWRKRMVVAATGLCALGVLGSHYLLLVHKVWSIAVPMQVRLALFPFAPFAHGAFEP